MATDYLPEQRLAFFLKRTQHGFRTRVDEDLRSLELTAPQYAVIAAIDAVSGISNAELARLAFVTPQSMLGIISNLERAGLITRSQHPKQGRILRSELTARGRKILRQARTRVNEVERLLIDTVGRANMDIVVDALCRCAEVLAAAPETAGSSAALKHVPKVSVRSAAVP